ncbi:MAG TPA: hypothetical protein O0X39_02850 [Methanocorpusculum sp.]|nr:hypothetical protein [Methanocorpusculum sp.]
MSRIFTRRNVIWAVSILVFIAIFVCVISNFAVSRQMTWLVFPVCSLILGWVIFIPVLHLKTAGIKYSLGMLTAVILPYLLVIDMWTKGDWFVPVALPITLAGLVFLWAAYFLWLKLKNRYYLSAVLLFLSGALSLFIWFIVQSPFPWGWLVFGITSVLTVLMVLTKLLLK